MNNLFTELQRRKVYKSATLYVVVSWGMVEAADVLLPTFNAPQWVLQSLVVLLVLGFPVALIISWLIDVTPSGIVVTTEDDPKSASTSSSFFNAAIMSLVIAAVLFLLFDRFLTRGNGQMVAPQREPFTAVGSNLTRTAINLEPLQLRPQGGYTSFDFSPDGRAIVYTSFDGNAFKLHYRALSSLDSRTLFESRSGVFLPKVSPSGDRILFWSSSDIYVIPINGGPTRFLASNVRPNSHNWVSADEVIYSHNPEASLQLVDMNGNSRPVPTAANREGIFIDPENVPETNIVLFSVGTEQWDLHALNIETGDSVELVRDAVEGQYLAPDHLLFVRGDFIWAVPFDPETLTITGSEIPLVEGVQNVYNYAAAAYAVSPQGQLVYLEGDPQISEGSRLKWASASGSDAILPLPAQDYRELTLSPGGEELALTIEQPGGSFDIWIYNFVSESLRRVTASGRSFRPVWSPDGKFLFFTDLAEEPGIWRINAFGTQAAEKIYSSDTLAGPEVFTADGRELLIIEGGEPNWNISMLTLTDDQVVRRELLATDFVERQVALSPDQRWLAYMSDETGEREVYVRPFPDLNGFKWLVSRQGGTEPVWSPDGRALYFIERNTQRLMRVPLTDTESFAASAPEFVTQLEMIRETEPNYQIGPEGRILTFAGSGDAGDSESETTASQAIYVDNWSQEVHRLAAGLGSD